MLRHTKRKFVLELRSHAKFLLETTFNVYKLLGHSIFLVWNLLRNIRLFLFMVRAILSLVWVGSSLDRKCVRAVIMLGYMQNPALSTQLCPASKENFNIYYYNQQSHYIDSCKECHSNKPINLLNR